MLTVPTAPTCPTRAAVAAEPVQRNAELGRYTNFVNLLGRAALAVPSGFAPSGLSFGVTFIAPGGSDAALVALGHRWEAARALPLGCRLRARTHSAPHFRLYALSGTVPPKPGLARVRDGEAGFAIALEVYDTPLAALGSFRALIPSPLGLGSVQLADGCWVKGFICEAAALDPASGAREISAFGGWRAYLAAR